MRWFKTSSVRYNLVPSSSSSFDKPDADTGAEVQGEYEDAITQHQPPKPHTSPLLKASCLIALLSTLLNILLFITKNNPTSEYFDRETTLFTSSSTSLPRPNQFLGLTRVNFSNSPLEQDLSLTVLPSLLAQVDRRFPGDVSNYGGTKVRNPHFVINEDVSMIAQFRARDYGLERCRIQLRIPNITSSSSSSSSNNNQRLWKVSKDLSSLSLYHLSPSPSTNAESNSNSNTWLDIHTLSYSTKPRRRAQIPLVPHTLNPDTNTDIIQYQSSEFECTTDSILSFELACTGTGCSIEGRRAYDSEESGLLMIERSSL